MKALVGILITVLPLVSFGQAHLGSTLSEIESMHPGKKFQISTTDEGIRYAYASMPLGTFYYVFSSESNVSELCMQFPDDLGALNTQIEIYNNKYVIESDTSWKAYLEGGGIMKINVSYDEELESYVFIYIESQDFSRPTTTNSNSGSTYHQL